MPEEHSHTNSWLRRITGSLTGEPRDLEDLNEVLSQAHERGIIDADAHQMLEGVLRVVELQVRDIMVPRSQMVIVNRDTKKGKKLFGYKEINVENMVQAIDSLK